jgi:FkbM family methyltransferase
MISFAQNYEDVMLWRALKDVKNGFYIDVGANDPEIDSVTKAFYLEGWHGINIEPVEAHFKDLQAQRSRDINLQCVVGEKNGTIKLYEPTTRGLATVDSQAIQELIESGCDGNYIEVPLRTLTEICKEFDVHDIHFLKIDVEGYEYQVLKGMDFKIFRPWVVVIEAVKPNSTIEVHHKCEFILLNAGYKFVYADGLNRFYISFEKSELEIKFKYPPNYFDEFVHIEQVKLGRRVEEAERRAADSLQALNAVYTSRSWKYTAFFRKMADKYRSLNNPDRRMAFIFYRFVKLGFKFFVLLFTKPLQIPFVLFRFTQKQIRKTIFSLVRMLLGV